MVNTSEMEHVNVDTRCSIAVVLLLLVYYLLLLRLFVWVFVRSCFVRLFGPCLVNILFGVHL